MKESLVKSSSFVFSSNALRLFSKFLTNLVSAKLLGPTNFGFYNLIDLVNKYGPLVNVGVASGISREIPITIGQGDVHEAGRINDVGFTGLLFTSTSSFLIISFFAILFLRGLATWGVIFAAAAIFANAVFEYQTVYLYCHSRFRRASKLISISSAVNLVITVVLVYTMGIMGQFEAIFLVPATVVAIVFVSGAYTFVPRFHFRIYKRIVKVGFPLILIGVGYTFMVTVDRLIIAKFLGVRELGYYSLAIMLFVFSQQIPTSVSQVIYPKLNVTFGASADAHSLEYTAVLPSFLLSTIMPFLLLVLILFIPLVVRLFLAEYAKGIVAAEIILIPVAFYGVNILNTLFKVRELLISLAFAAALKIALSILLVTLNFGINGVAIASALSLVGYTLSISTLSLFHLGKKTGYILRYAGLIGVLPCLFVLSFVLYVNGLVQAPIVGGVACVYASLVGYVAFKSRLHPEKLFQTYQMILTP